MYENFVAKEHGFWVDIISLKCRGDGAMHSTRTV